MVGSGDVLFPHQILFFYENSYHIFSVESTTCFRDSSRKIVTKNPLFRGDFSIGRAMKLFTKYFVVITWQEDYIRFFLKSKDFWEWEFVHFAFWEPFSILSWLLASRRSMEVYPLTFFLHEKSLLWSSILEASVCQNRILSQTETSREAATLDSAKKNPHANGDFSKEIYLCLLWRREYYIRFFLKSKDFAELKTSDIQNQLLHTFRIQKFASNPVYTTSTGSPHRVI